MEHQLCRFCGDRHPLGPCPSFKGDTKLQKMERVARAVGKIKFDKKEWQKNYLKTYQPKWRKNRNKGKQNEHPDSPKDT